MEWNSNFMNRVPFAKPLKSFSVLLFEKQLELRCEGLKFDPEKKHAS